MKRRNWTEEEDQKLRELYPNFRTIRVAERLCRTESSVNTRAQKLGLKKRSEHMEIMKIYFSENLRRVGVQSRYKKGQIPHNKGKKMPFNANSARTQFKKGHLPVNTKQDGVISIRMLKHGHGGKIKVPHKFIRIDLSKWIELKKHIWEKHNGPIPAGMLFTHKDGNTLNCDITNLELITKKESMERARNSDEYIAARIASIKGGKGIIDRTMFNEVMQRPDLIEAKRQQLRLAKILKNKE